MLRIIGNLTPEQCAMEENFDLLVLGMVARFLGDFSDDGRVNPAVAEMIFRSVVVHQRNTKIEEIGKALSEQTAGRGITLYGPLTAMKFTEIIVAYLELHGDVYERANSKFKEPYDSDRGRLEAGEERLKHQLARTQYLNEQDIQKQQEGKGIEPPQDDGQ
jgi:hypothetical protein